MKKIRVFVGPVEISGIAGALASALSGLGCRANLVLAVPHPYSYGSICPSSKVEVFWQFVGRARWSTKPRNIFLKIFFLLAHRIVGWSVFIKAIFSYDAFVFTFGQTMTESWLELFLLRLLNKKIIFIYFGSDVRPPYMDGASVQGQINNIVVDRVNNRARRIKRKVCIQEKMADYIVNSPSTAQYQNLPFVNWFSMGVPVSAVDVVPEKVDCEKNYVRILHSPSNPEAKGTVEIENAIKSLLDKGYAIEFEKITGVANSVVKEKLKWCDFVVDQVYSDTPMAVFAVEAALYRKPTVVAGYFAECATELINQKKIPPSLFVMPEKLELAIEKMITQPEFRVSLGNDAYAFVRSVWDPAEVGKRYLRLLNDDVPSEWMYSPDKLTYIGGWGVSKTKLKEFVGALVKRHGISALGVEDKPLLSQNFIQLIQDRENAQSCD